MTRRRPPAGSVLLDGERSQNPPCADRKAIGEGARPPIIARQLGRDIFLRAAVGEIFRGGAGSRVSIPFVSSIDR